MSYIIGCDECGYGSLACDLIVCGVKAPINWSMEGLRDSKKLTAKRRETLNLKLREDKEIKFYIASRSNEEIDKYGLGVMHKSAFVETFHNLHSDDCFIIVDGVLKFDGLGVDAYDIRTEVKADDKYPVVMAASIIAKTYRDKLMKDYHEDYPNYGWNSNVGYGSTFHINAIKKHGFSPLHRISYKIKSMHKLP